MMRLPACGFSPPAGSPASPVTSISSRPPAQRLLTPRTVKKAIVQIPPSRENVHAALTGSGVDTLTGRSTASGTGTLAVTNDAGQPLWTLAHVGGVFVLDFGRRHRPVVLVQGDVFDCGSGGFQYRGYTWNPSTEKFVTGADPETLAYRFIPGTRQFRLSVVASGGLFGLVEIRYGRLVLVSRTYDHWQHAIITPLRYETCGAGDAGGFTTIGPAHYTPPRGRLIAPVNEPLMVLWSFRHGA